MAGPSVPPGPPYVMPMAEAITSPAAKSPPMGRPSTSIAEASVSMQPASVSHAGWLTYS